MRRWGWLAGLTLLMSANAAAEVAVNTAIFLEEQADTISVSKAERFLSGDRVVTILRWNAPQRGRYTLTSAVPQGLSLRSASREGIDYSTDGGRSWRRASNARNLPHGITHLRWQAGPGEGRISYRSVVM